MYNCVIFDGKDLLSRREATSAVRYKSYISRITHLSSRSTCFILIRLIRDRGEVGHASAQNTMPTKAFFTGTGTGTGTGTEAKYRGEM